MYKKRHILLLLLLFSALIGHCLANAGTLGPTIGEKPNFDSESEADKLYSAITKKDTDTITSIICSINNQQRLMLADEFKKSYGIDVTDALSELFGIVAVEKLTGNTTPTATNYRKLMVALMTPPAYYDAKQMYKAITDNHNSVLIEILATRTNEQIDQIRNAYSTQTAGLGLEKDISETIKSHFRRLLISLLNCSRDESDKLDTTKAQQDANLLYAARRKGKLSMDSENPHVFNKVFAKRNLAQLPEIFNFYHYSANYSIETGIENEFSAYDKDGYLALIEYANDSAKYFAKLLHKNLYGINPTHKNRNLIRLIVSRSEIDLADIKIAYNKLSTKTSLEKRIKQRASGIYKKALLALLSGNVSTVGNINTTGNISTTGNINATGATTSAHNATKENQDGQESEESEKTEQFEYDSDSI